MDARIGILTRAGRPVFYAFARGYDAPAVEGTLDEVEAALGISKAKPRPSLRDWNVTVTPRTIAYCGTSTLSAYTVTITARTRGEAIKAARQQRNDEEGRYAPRATFTAKLTK